MANSIYFHIFSLICIVDAIFCVADHVLTAETSFSIFTPWNDANAVNSVLLELPKDKKRALDDTHGTNEADDQLMVRIRIGPSHNVGVIEKYLVINDIYDPKRQMKDQALVPYVIEVIRGEPVISYPLQYLEDIKLDKYSERSAAHNKKKSSQKQFSSKQANFAEDEHKPSVSELNAENIYTVVKELSELFSSKGKKPDSDNESETSDMKKENDKTKEAGHAAAGLLLAYRESPRKVYLTKESKDYDEKGNDDLNENGLRDTKSLRHGEDDDDDSPHKEHQLENSCLKLHIFENWKNQRSFDDEHTQSSEFNKHFKTNNDDFKPMASEIIESNERSAEVEGANSLNNKISGHDEIQDAKRLKRKELCPRIELDENLPSIQDVVKDFKSSKNNNRMKRLPQSLLKKNYGISSSPQQKMARSGLSSIQAESGYNKGIKSLRSNSRHQEDNRKLEKRLSSKARRDKHFEPENANHHQHFRLKRSSLSENDLNDEYYKNEDNTESDQCERNKMNADNDFDLQACDTCGGKSKKPQPKPPNPSNVRLNQQGGGGEDAVEQAALLPRDSAQKEVCRCMYGDPCICCVGKKLRRNPAWFSVFDLCAPTAFVTSRIRIFRKRRGVWWEVAPPTNLNTMSGVYSDGNYSFSFSSPIELFQLEKALRLQDQQLLFPSYHEQDEDADDVKRKKLAPEGVETKIFHSKELRNNPSHIMTLHKKPSPNKKRVPELRPLTDFGYFPSTANTIEKCPHDDKRLCLNVLTDEAPASTFKVQMPFRENVLVHKDMIRIQISNIITDATTRDAMQISVLVINKGVQSRLVTLSISNCPTGSDSSLTEAKSCVEKVLLPNIAETATFLLPLIQPAKTQHKRFECKVEVLTKCDDGNVKVVSKRKFLVEPQKRCLCIWTCACHCIPKFVPHDDNNMCKKMSASARNAAGFPKDSAQGYFDGQESQCKENIFYKFLRYALYLLLLILLLGLIKALLGLCICKIDCCCFDYVYPNPGYCCSSRCRRFWGNVFIFVVLPFRFLCTCFTPSPEDLLVASSEWQCCQGPGPMCEDEFDTCDMLCKKKIPSKRLMSGIEAKQQVLSERLSRLSLAFREEITDEESSPKKAPKTPSEIIRTLSERRDQRRRSRQNLPSTSTTANRDKQAIELVHLLLDAKRVYRTLREPIGNVSKIPHGVKYCIQGYFIATLDAAFEFVSFQPLVQYRGISSETFITKELHPPIFLSSGAFGRRYFNEAAVLKSADLTVQPPDGVPCINIRSIDDGTETETSSATAPNKQAVSRREQRPSMRRTQR